MNHPFRSDSLVIREFIPSFNVEIVTESSSKLARLQFSNTVLQSLPFTKKIYLAADFLIFITHFPVKGDTHFLSKMINLENPIDHNGQFLGYNT